MMQIDLRDSSPYWITRDFEKKIELDTSITAQWESFYTKQQEKLSPEAVDFLARVFYTGYTAHTHYPKHPDKAFRNTGEVFMTHPLAVAELADEFNLDTEIKAIALLHDVDEDTTISVDMIASLFGKSIVDPVDRLTKIRGLSPATDKAETRLRIFSGLIDDPRIVIVKLLDRLHNMRTIKGISDTKPENARAIANETLEYFVPLADIIGIPKLRDELIERSFAVLDPTIITAAQERQTEWIDNTRVSIQHVQETLINITDGKMFSNFEKPTLDLFIRNTELGELEITTPEPIVEFVYSAEHAKNIFESINSLYNHKVITEPIATDYEFPFSLADKKFTIRLVPQIRYQSNHSSLINLYQQDRDEGSPDYIRENILVNEKLSAIRLLITQLRERKITAEEFDTFMADQIKTIRLPHVRLITPKGEIIPLLRGTTVHEGASFIHEAVFRSAVAAEIGTSIVSLNTPIQHDQHVEYITNPSGEWNIDPYMLDYVKGDRAKQNLREGLKLLVETSTRERQEAKKIYQSNISETDMTEEELSNTPPEPEILTHDEPNHSFYIEAAGKARYDVVPFGHYLDRVTLRAEERGLEIMMKKYLEYRTFMLALPTQHNKQLPEIPYNFDFNKVWQLVGPGWRTKFHDWHSFIQSAGCDLVEQNFVDDFIKACFLFEQSLQRTATITTEDRAGVLMNLLEEIRNNNISVADVVIERNVPGIDPEDVSFHFVLYPTNVNLLNLNLHLRRSMKVR